MSKHPRRARRWLRPLLTLLLAGLAVHLILPQIATLEHSVNVIKGMAWWAVGLAAAAQAMSYVGSGVLLSAIAAMTGSRLRALRGTAITAASNSVGLVAGGLVGSGVTAYRWVNRSGVSSEGALLSLWLPGLAEDSVLLVVTILGMIYLLIVHDLSRLQVLSFGIVLLILILLVAGLARAVQRRPQVTGLAVRLARWWSGVRHRPFSPAPTQKSVARVVDGLDRLRSRGWRGPILGAMLNIGFDMLTVYLVFIAAGHRVSLEVLMAGYGLPLLLGKVPILPGGLGVIESSMTAMYMGLGVPKEVAAVVVLVYRLLSFWLPLLIGLAFVPYLQHTADGAGVSGIPEAGARDLTQQEEP